MDFLFSRIFFDFFVLFGRGLKFIQAPSRQVLCCVKELLEQFVGQVHRPEGAQEDESLYFILLHPFTLNSLAKGHQLKIYVPCFTQEVIGLASCGWECF